jgi:hypothetical protein
MYQEPVASPYSHNLTGTGTANLVPWMALHRTTGAKDGLGPANKLLSESVVDYGSICGVDVF